MSQILTPKMRRYALVRQLYPLLSLIAQLYFAFVNRLFALVNALKPGLKVEWTESEQTNQLLFLSAKKAAQKIRQKEISSEQLVRAYIGRIRHVQPQINAVTAENFEAAIESAKAVDAYLAQQDEASDEFKNLSETKPLLGVPFSVKNNMDVEGFVTVAGFKPWLNNAPAQRDSVAVERLRSAGAIPLALTNLPKLGMDWCAENSVYGRTSNPFDSRRIPGGSSGGEGALIGAGASLFGVGTDLAGSIRIPAHFCGVYGLKATKDAVPVEGHSPSPVMESAVGRAQLAVGPLCRYAEDLPLLFATMTGRRPSEVDVQVDFGQVRVSYMEDLHIWFCESPSLEVRQALTKVVLGENMRTANCLLSPVCSPFRNCARGARPKGGLPTCQPPLRNVGRLGLRFPITGIVPLLLELPKLVCGLSDQTNMAWFFGVLHAFVQTRSEEERTFMLQKLEKLGAQFRSALAGDSVLILPPWPTAAPFHWQNVFTSLNVPYAQLFNVLGLPSLVCPVHTDQRTGVPIGVQLVGGPHSEPLLMAAALELERAFGGWQRQ